VGMGGERSAYLSAPIHKHTHVVDSRVSLAGTSAAILSRAPWSSLKQRRRALGGVEEPKDVEDWQRGGPLGGEGEGPARGGRRERWVLIRLMSARAVEAEPTGPSITHAVSLVGQLEGVRLR
jgi:hypothetical protein